MIAMPDRDHGEEARPPCSAEQSKSAPSHGADAPDKPRQGPIEDLEVVYEVEFTEPGSALDEQLRREQTKAVLDLLTAYKRKHPD
jgi:hypothetical protein